MKPRPEKALIEEVALAWNMAEALVEKDWFVTQAIAAIAMIDYQGFEVVSALKFCPKCCQLKL
jgi:hypothetical protein